MYKKATDLAERHLNTENKVRIDMREVWEHRKSALQALTNQKRPVEPLFKGEIVSISDIKTRLHAVSPDLPVPLNTPSLNSRQSNPPDQFHES